MPQIKPIRCIVPQSMGPCRFDQAAANLYPQYSRSQLTRWIKAGQVTVNNKILKPKERLIGGEELAVFPQEEIKSPERPEAIPLDIRYEDEAFLIVNKPAGLVVHPAAGNWSGTLVNALLHHYSKLEQLPRAGIVHRLDKETTGLLVVAKTDQAYQNLGDQLRARTVSRDYLALVQGTVVAGATIDEPMGRHPVDRKRMAVQPGGRLAVTHYRVSERFSYHTLLHVMLETGRTHQIRVHLSYKKLPIVGDPLYGGRARIPAGISEALRDHLQQFPRQALHAWRLTLAHPLSGEKICCECPLPQDFADLLQHLRDNEQEKLKG